MDDGEVVGGDEGGGMVVKGVGCMVCWVRRNSMWPNMTWSSSRRE